MGLMDKVKQAAKGKSEMLEKGIDSAVQQVDRRTKGKYSDKLTKGAEDLKEKARRLDEERAGRTDAPGGFDGPTSPPSSTPSTPPPARPAARDFPEEAPPSPS